VGEAARKGLPQIGAMVYGVAMWRSMERNRSLEFWLDYADMKRRLARQWTALATTMPAHRAAEFRRLAKEALCGAQEADELVRIRVARLPRQ